MENIFTEEVFIKNRPQNIAMRHTRTVLDASLGITERDLAGHATVLVITDAGLTHRTLVQDILRLGRRAVTARSPLGAIVRLQDHSLAIDLLLAPSHDPTFSLLDFFTFVEEEFPHLRRIAYAQNGAHKALEIDG